MALHNRLPPTYARRDDFERAITSALAGFRGTWEVALEPPGEHALVVAIVAPDGSSWSMTCCNPQQWDPQAVAETVRGACSKDRWLGPLGDGAGPA